MRSAGVFLFIALLWFPSARADQVEQVKQLVGYFSASCPSLGSWTQSAMEKADQLITSLKALESDPRCRSIASAAGQVGLLRNKIAQFQGLRNERDLMALRRKQEQILLQLSSSVSAEELADLRKQLFSTQVEIAEREGDQVAESQVTRKAASDTFEDIVVSTRALLERASQSSDCFLSNESRATNVLSGIASMAGSVGAAVATSGASLGVAAGVEILAQVIEWARIDGVQRRIRALNEGVTQSAFLCVLESLSQQWCSAQDALRILDLKTNGRFQETPLTRGIRILDREQAVFLSWLRAVRAGAPTSSEAEAERRRRVNARIAKLDESRYFVQGIIADYSEIFRPFSSGSAEERWRIVKPALLRISARIYPEQSFGSDNSVENPFEDFSSSTCFPYLLMGLTLSEAPKSGYGQGCKRLVDFDPLSDWPAGKTFDPDLATPRRQFAAISQEIEDRLNTERTSVFVPDPDSILDLAETSALEGPRKGLSPRISVKRLVDYLRGYSPSTYGNPSQRRMFEDTAQRLEEIMKTIEPSADSTSPPVPPIDTVEKVYGLAKLNYGTTFFEGRLNRAIRLILVDLIVSGRSGLDEQTAVQLLAAEDILSELARLSPSGSYAYLKRDLEGSQRVVEATTRAFREVFPKTLTEILRSLSTQAARPGPDSEKYKNALAQACFGFLILPEFKLQSLQSSSTIDMRLCRGAELRSIYKQRASIRFSDEHLTMPLTKRACLSRDFVRGEDLLQQFESNRGLNSLARSRSQVSR